MKKDVTRIAVKPLRWLVDDRLHAAVLVALPAHDAHLTVSLTALAVQPGSSICSLNVHCARRRQTLDYTLALRVTGADGAEPDSEEPDLAQFLTAHVASRDFQRRVLVRFVARLQACGMI